ncbi:MAG TPA: short-chain fatty acyl-CoA regulator family protein [Burkholderiaceae bacterium]|nr:short-chain fatty acyl-CoA regulator family protein [Burkholderiaceae bacterium]
MRSTQALLVGPRIRDRRRALGITQASLAAALGISASYLNLIEAGRRSIGGALLKHIADALGLAVDDLDGAAERRLLADLTELTAEPVLHGLGLDRAAAADVAGHHPQWARALVALHRAWLDRGRAVNALSDRLRHDPFLADAVHSLLTRVAAIKSSAEIVEHAENLAPAQLRRFATIVGSDSRRLADLAQALAAFFERAHSAVRSVTPAGEVDDFLADRDHYFPALEEAADALRKTAGITGDDDIEPRLASLLESRHGERPPPGTTRLELALRAAESTGGDDPLAAELQRATSLTNDAARRRAGRALAAYLAAAIVMPYDEFLAAARRVKFDAEALGRTFGVGFAHACGRLVTLRRPGAEGVPFALMRIDAAGYLTRRVPLPRLTLPRHGSACPLWAIYLALQSPGALVRQLVEFPGGERFLLVARTVDEPGPAFPMPRRLASVMLACNVLYADQTVYCDGLDLASAARAVPVGPNCRVCPRTDCAFRQEDPVIDA